jgi:shikimate kinase
MSERTIVYVIGFMGSGKTTVGKKLALALDWSFIDLDLRIEEATGKTIAELFSIYGEDYFRNVESEVLRKLKYQVNTVVSTGGGTPCHKDNMTFMKETGLTLYLKMTPGQLASRLAGSKGERPLLKNLDSESLLRFIEEKLSSREKWYSLAEIKVDGFNTDIKLLQNIVKSGLNL